MDAARLFTPISAIGVYYIIYATMKIITHVSSQYAIKVSYSKDRVHFWLGRNCSS
jgi:threonine/homoserine/homoserine lactone efflux protein